MSDNRNTFKTETEEIKPQTESQAAGKKNTVGGKVKNILEGSFLAKEKATRMLPFLVFLTILGIILIYNSNFANKTAIEISKTKKQIEEYRYSYINTKSKLVQTTKQSEIAKRIAKSGVKESKIPPRKIVVESNN